LTSFTGSSSKTSEWRHFKLDISNQVAWLVFDRPERLNALTFEVYADLRDLFTELPQQHADVRVLVITGTGRGFCSGGDVHEIIGELLNRGAGSHLEFTRMTCEVVQRMREMPIPIVAAINGIAAGAGAVIALASDFRIMTHDAAFRFLFTKVGLSGADMGAAYLLPRIIGLGRATEILMFGDAVNAQHAVEIGLANRTVDSDQLKPEAQKLCDRLVKGPALAYANTKKLLSRELDTDLASSLELDATTQALLMNSSDHREFYNAFVDKRDPLWEGR
jgi:enoyl-CoA hydratase/carnithine racemase